jgi:hypothetical protein
MRLRAQHVVYCHDFRRDKPAAFGDLLWEVSVVQLATFLDRLTLLDHKHPCSGPFSRRGWYC